MEEARQIQHTTKNKQRGARKKRVGGIGSLNCIHSAESQRFDHRERNFFKDMLDAVAHISMHTFC